MKEKVIFICWQDFVEITFFPKQTKKVTSRMAIVIISNGSDRFIKDITWCVFGVIILYVIGFFSSGILAFRNLSFWSLLLVCVSVSLAFVSSKALMMMTWESKVD